MAEKSAGLTIIIPTFNEGASIASTIAGLKTIAPKLNRAMEILVVDDGSTDDSASLARAEGAKVIRHPINGGYGRSLLTGIEHASYDTVAIMDADATYPADRLHDLLAFFDRGFDMVVGARQGKHYIGSRQQGFLRMVFRWLAEYTCGRSIPDINSGFRIFDRKPVLAWRASLSTGFSFTTTITLLFMLNNLFVGYLPIDYHQRAGKSKVRLFRDGFRSLQIIFTAIAQFNPLKLYLLLIIGNVAITLGLLALMVAAWIGPVIGWYVVFSLSTLSFIVAIAILAVAAIKPARNPTDVWDRPRRLEI